ncbi:MAG: ribbon-helix-helix protein, CopG family [Rhodocyclaceae bacterium]|nr:ribbon-helix-helix protein, CopG family [Rhodocyclaceae bacterium]
MKRSASERAAASRSQREADGSRRVEVMLDPDTLAALDSLAQADGTTRGEVVSRLIRNAHRRRRAIPAAARDGHA